MGRPPPTAADAAHGWPTGEAVLGIVTARATLEPNDPADAALLRIARQLHGRQQQLFGGGDVGPHHHFLCLDDFLLDLHLQMRRFDPRRPSWSRMCDRMGAIPAPPPTKIISAWPSVAKKLP